MIRLTSFLVRADAFTHKEFVRYWHDEHAPIARELPGLRRYSVNRALTPTAGFDGVAELSFESVSAFERVLGADAETDAMADVNNFIARTERHLLAEPTDTETPSSAEHTVSELLVLARGPGVEPDRFTERLEEATAASARDPSVESCFVATPVEDTTRYDAVMKRSFDSEASYDRHREERASGDPTGHDGLEAVSETTISFAGWETTVVEAR